MFYKIKCIFKIQPDTALTYEPHSGKKRRNPLSLAYQQWYHYN